MAFNFMKILMSKLYIKYNIRVVQSQCDFIIAFPNMATIQTLLLFHQNISYLTIHMKLFSFQPLIFRLLI